MPKSSTAIRTPSSRSALSRSIASSTSSIITLSVISSSRRLGSRPLERSAVAHLVDDLHALQLPRRDVDRDEALLCMRVGLLEGHGVFACAVEDPAAERDDQAGILRDGDERRRRHGAAHRRAPNAAAPRSR